MPRPLHRLALTAAILAAWVGVCGAADDAAPRQFWIELPAGQVISYRIEFTPVAAGTLRIEAEWDTSRILTLRLERPDGGVLRRSGPSPQEIVALVSDEEIRGEEPWVLAVRGLPSRVAGDGLVSVELPSDRPPVEPDPVPEAPPEPEREPWQRRLAPPPGLSAPRLRLWRATERFRALAVDGADERPDRCGWQVDLLRELAGRREDPSGGTPLGDSTRDVLLRLVDAVADVDTMRVSEDPLLAGPEPRDPGERRAWAALRRSRVQPVRRTLDRLMADLQRGYAPDLQSSIWPRRLVSCLTACERYYEERARLGRVRAPYGPLAADQWDRILSAADALDALLELDPR